MERASVLVAASALCLFAFAPAAQAQPVHLHGTTRSESVDVAGGASRRLFVECPQGRGRRAPDVALAGSSAPPAGVQLTASVPLRRRWGFRFNNTDSVTHRVRGIVRCLRIPVPRAIASMAYRFARRGRSASFSPGQIRSLPVRCPSGFSATGYGIRYLGGSLRLYGVVPSSGGFRFGLREIGGGTAGAELFAQCVSRRGAATSRRGTRLGFQIPIKRRAFTNSIPSGGGRVRHSCALGDSSLSPAFRFSPIGPLSLVAERIAGQRSARWLFSNPGPLPAPVATFVVCLGGRSSFFLR